MRLTRIAIFLLILLSTVLAGAQLWARETIDLAAAPPADWIRSAGNGYTLAHPPGWTLHVMPRDPRSPAMTGTPLRMMRLESPGGGEMELIAGTPETTLERLFSIRPAPRAARRHGCTVGRLQGEMLTGEEGGWRVRQLDLADPAVGGFRLLVRYRAPLAQAPAFDRVAGSLTLPGP